jgi:hypothetical protein
MSPCFADSFLFFALLDDGDDAHEAALATVRRLHRVVWTTPWVLTEVADGFAATGNRHCFQQLLAIIGRQPLIRVIPATQRLFDRGVELYLGRPDKEWSLTDCISFVVMRDEGLSEALTADRHFEQAGFVPLMKQD